MINQHSVTIITFNNRTVSFRSIKIIKYFISRRTLSCALSFGMLIQDPDIFSFFLKQSFNISSRAGLWAMNSLGFYLSEHAFSPHLFLKGNYTPLEL